MYHEDSAEELFCTFLTMAGYRDGWHEWPSAVRERADTLVARCVRERPDWTLRLLGWLRTDTAMRYPALVAAATAVASHLAANDVPSGHTGDQPGFARQVLRAVLRRPDDPGQFLAHWAGRHGRSLPKPVRRGVADAVTTLYDERAVFRYDTGGHHVAFGRFVWEELTFRGGNPAPRPYRFGQVVALTHPRPRDPAQADLFRWVLDRWRGRGQPPPPRLLLAARRHELLHRPAVQRRELLRQESIILGGELAELGIDWRVLAGWAGRRPDARTWQHLVPHLSYVELLSSLRRFDSAGIPFETAMTVAVRLAEPEQLRRSGVGPLLVAAARFAVAHQRWVPVLDEVARHSLDTVPALAGRTLVVVATDEPDAVVFGLALAARCASADVVAADGTPFDLVAGESPTHGWLRWQTAGLTDRAGVDYRPLAGTYAGHDRVVLVDAYVRPLDVLGVPDSVPVYAWQTGYNRGGPTGGAGPRRLVFHGLDDAAFAAIPLVEAARSGCWPF